MVSFTEVLKYVEKKYKPMTLTGGDTNAGPIRINAKFFIKNEDFQFGLKYHFYKNFLRTLLTRTTSNLSVHRSTIKLVTTSSDQSDEVTDRFTWDESSSGIKWLEKDMLWEKLCVWQWYSLKIKTLSKIWKFFEKTALVHLLFGCGMVSTSQWKILKLDSSSKLIFGGEGTITLSWLTLSINKSFWRFMLKLLSQRQDLIPTSFRSFSWLFLFLWKVCIYFQRCLVYTRW